MKVYEPGPEEDLLLLQLYSTMVQAGDLEKAFTSPMKSLTTFMARLQPPSILVYEADKDGMWFVAWFDYILSALTLGLWVREDYRDQPKTTAPLLQESLRAIFGLTPVIVAITRDPKVVKSAQLFGFQKHGIIPHIWEGEAAYIMSVTKEDFEKTNGV